MTFGGLGKDLPDPLGSRLPGPFGRVAYGVVEISGESNSQERGLARLRERRAAANTPQGVVHSPFDVGVIDNASLAVVQHFALPDIGT